jgi:hypothetical protein
MDDMTAINKIEELTNGEYTIRNKKTAELVKTIEVEEVKEITDGFDIFTNGTYKSQGYTKQMILRIESTKKGWKVTML